MYEEVAISKGITDDFAWYELSRVRSRLSELSRMISSLEESLKERSAEQHAYFQHLQSKISALQAQTTAKE